MSQEPSAIRETASVREAMLALRSLDVRHLPVLDADHEVVGMLSDRDLSGLPVAAIEVEEVVDGRSARLDGPVSAIMSGDLIDAKEDDELTDIAETMIERRIGAIPITSPEGNLLGIVSYVDILRHFVASEREGTGPSTPAPLPPAPRSTRTGHGRKPAASAKAPSARR